MEPEVTLEILKLFLQKQACTHETIGELLYPPRIREHLATHEWHFKRIGVDIRTRQKKIEDVKKENERKHRQAVYLSAEYDRLKLFEEVWSDPMQRLAKKYNLSNVGLNQATGEWATQAATFKFLQRPFVQRRL